MQRTAGLSQEEFAEKTGLTANYISTVERGMSFPRCEKLIILLNGLEVSADAIFCDVLDHSTSYKASELSKKLDVKVKVSKLLIFAVNNKAANLYIIYKCDYICASLYFFLM